MIRQSATAALLAGALALPLSMAGAAHHEADAAMARADVIDGEGNKVGMVTLEETPNGVLVSADVENIPSGEHGFHIHEKGICDPAEGFKTAGGHYAPRSHDHGLREAAGPHAGDMPNQVADDHEMLRARVLNPYVTLHAGFNTLFDEDGSALVIHAGADDYKSQPSGAAGARLACAVIAPPKGL